MFKSSLMVFCENARSGYKKLSQLYSRIFNRYFPKNVFNYGKDGLYTMHNADFIKSNAFNYAYTQAKNTNSWGAADLEWRAHVCLWLGLQASRLEGDFVECGTNRGGMVTALLTYLADNPEFKNKLFYCFDTFEGLSENYASTTECANTFGHYDNCFDEVKEHFSHFPQVKLIKGPIPDTLIDFSCGKVAFIHIDMNSTIPEIAAAEFFWTHLISGGYMLLDDFAWEVCKEQREAFIRFAEKYQVEILWLPTGQGLIQKP